MPVVPSQINIVSGAVAPDVMQAGFDQFHSELRARTQLFSAQSSGIVAASDPVTITVSSDPATETTAPLWIVQATADQLTWQLTPGQAVTTSGRQLSIETAFTFNIADSSEGAINVVLLGWKTVGIEHFVVDPTGAVSDTGSRDIPAVYCWKLTDYQAYLYSGDAILDEMVVVGVISFPASSGAIVDASRSIYAWNRPWFSVSDTFHRSQIGTGTVSAINPHGTSINDLQIANLTIYEQLTSSGLVVSKDVGIPGIPGMYCYKSMTAAEVLRDADGSATTGSKYNKAGAKYFRCPNYPNAIAVVRDAQTLREIPVDWIAGTPLVVFSPWAVVPSFFEVWYFYTPSLGLAKVSSNSLVFNSVSGKEMLVSEGHAVPGLSSSGVVFRRYGRIPRKISVGVDSRGIVFPDPQVVVPAANTMDIRGVLQVEEAVLFTASRIGVGLTGFAAAPNAYIAFQLNGKDAEGVAISEIVEFSAANTEEAVVPSRVESATQVKYTQAVFSELVSWEVLDSGNFISRDVAYNCAATIYARSRSGAGFAELATAVWDGTTLVDVRDTRRVLTTVRDGYYGHTALHLAASALEAQPGGNGLHLIAAEDFVQPTFLNATQSDWRGSQSRYPVIPVEVTDSSQVSSCYCSRSLPVGTPIGWALQLVVVLFETPADATNAQGAVRVRLRDESDAEYEAVLVPKPNTQNRVWLGYFAKEYKSAAFVISGSSGGFAAYYTQVVHPESAFQVTPVATGN